jgi:uncharacterized phiE125 gp8 family phage protein
MKIITSVSSTDEPIKLEEAKSHLRVDINDDDNLIQNLIKVARENAENWMARALLPQTKILYLDGWPDKLFIKVPFPPLISVTSVTYTDYNFVVYPLSTSVYTVDSVSIPGRVILNWGVIWPITMLCRNNPIAITFTCGYSDVSSIPESIKQGMKIDIADMYEQREPRVLGGGTMVQIPILERLYSGYTDWTWKI